MSQLQTQPAAKPANAFKLDVERFASEYLIQVLGSEAGARAAARVAMAFRTLAQRNPKMSQCTRESVGVCVAMCAMTGLSPGGAYPDCDVIPREVSVQKGGEWTKELQLNWQIGFRGIIRLARRAGASIKAQVIYAGQASAERNGEVREVTSIYAIEGLRDAGYTIILSDPPPMDQRSLDNALGVLVKVSTETWADTIVMDREMIAKRRAKSEGWRRAASDMNAREAWKREKAQASPWIEWEEEMISKTGIRYAASRGLVPLDDVLDHAMAVDLAADTADTTAIDAAETVRPTPAAVPEPRQIAAPPPVDDFDPEEEARTMTAREKLEIRADESGMPLAAYLGSLGWTKPPDAMTDADAERLLSARAK